MQLLLNKSTLSYSKIKMMDFSYARESYYVWKPCLAEFKMMTNVIAKHSKEGLVCEVVFVVAFIPGKQIFLFWLL